MRKSRCGIGLYCSTWTGPSGGGRLVERLLQRGTVADVGGETLRGDLVAAQLVGQGIRVDLTGDQGDVEAFTADNRRPTAAPRYPEQVLTRSMSACPTPTAPHWPSPAWGRPTWRMCIAALRQGPRGAVTDMALMASPGLRPS